MAVSIFGVPWGELTLDDVTAFLREADDEPLLWEAKGTALDKREICRQVCGFANSHEGGYLILGADRVTAAGADARTWTVEGVPFRDEPRTWISNVIGNLERGVRPMPDFDVASWPTARGHVAVVRVAPTPTPPCITNGTLYERIPGKTITVRDPLRLADLYARGDRARTDAQARADRAAATLHSSQARLGDAIEFTVAVAATGNSHDIAAKLFRQEFADALWDRLDQRPQGLPVPFRQPPDAVVWSQHALSCSHQTRGPASALTIARASWDGGVALHQQLDTHDARVESLVSSCVEPAWRMADELLRELGAFGDVYVSVLFSGGPFSPAAPPQEDLTIELRRGPLLPGVDPLHVATVTRELQRALQIPAPEP
ncbi:MAG: ATP-binding protein [Chloroflexota bacterium]|nr:ATP-binding protein [Chloroflexota bacterium]